MMILPKSHTGGIDSMTENVATAQAPDQVTGGIPPKEIHSPLSWKTRIQKGDRFRLNTDIRVLYGKKGLSSFSKGTEVVATGSIFGKKKLRRVEVTIGKKNVRTQVPIECLASILTPSAASMN